MAYTVLSSGKGGVLVEDTDNLIQTSEAGRDLPKEEIQETSDAEVLRKPLRESPSLQGWDESRILTLIYL